jgi:hypothetical protein
VDKRALSERDICTTFISPERFVLIRADLELKLQRAKATAGKLVGAVVAELLA